MNRNCNCHPPRVRITRGNDFTIEARTSVYDTEKGMYVPFDISAAEDVAISIVGLYSRISGGDEKVSPEGVSASFPGTVPVGRYGVEILFRDSEGKGRIFERNLFEVVGSSGEATLESSAEGGSGEGLNVSVDLRTRTVRVGQTTGVTDYTLLDNKPSIGGVELEGDKTPEELGLYSREEADGLLGGKADKSEIPTKTSELENDSDYATNAKVDSSVEALKPYDCTWAWDLSQGDEAPADKVDELRKAINAKRPLYTESTNSNGFLLNLGVLAKLDDKDDTIITMTAIGRYSSNIYGSWVIIDDKTSDDYAYSVVSKGEKALQDVLVSGESIKTVNGESLLGSGDITASLRQLTNQERETLYTVASKVKASTEEMITITEELYNALAALPDTGLIGKTLITKRAETSSEYTLYYLSGVSDVDDERYSDFAFVAVAGEDGVTQYAAMIYADSNAVPKSVRLTANADGTLTSDTTPSSISGYDKALSSFPVMIVWRAVSGQIMKKNNVRCCFAQDVQTMKNDSSYSDTIQTVFLSLNGVYYKWVGTTLTPVRSAVGQTPVVYTFAANDDGTFGDVGMDDTGRFSIIDELEFKAANPTKSNLMVKVVSGGVSYWLSNVSLADGVIMCSGYVPQDKATLALTITSEGKVSMTRTGASVAIDTSKEYIEIADGKTYYGGVTISSLVIKNADSPSESVCGGCDFYFRTGTAAPAITLPDGVKWANNDVPSFKADRIYELNFKNVPILNGIVLIGAYAEYTV